MERGRIFYKLETVLIDDLLSTTYLFDVAMILFLIDHFSISKIQIALTKEEEYECCTNGKQIGNYCRND